MLTVSNPSKPNIFNVLSNRELDPRKLERHYINDCLIQKNIKNNNFCEKIIGKHDGYIITFEILNPFAATLSRKTIKLRNMETGKDVWSFTPDPPVYWMEIIKIIDGKIICAGHKKISDKPEYESTIRIIDLLKGKQTADIKNKQIEDNKVCMVGKRIFSVYPTGIIGEWDLDGNAVQQIQSEKLNKNSMFLSSELFLVHLEDNIVIIHDIIKNNKRIVDLNFEKGSLPNISHAYINGTRLICGFNKFSNRPLPDCCVVELDSGKITDKYFAHGDFFPLGDENAHESFLKESSSIKKIIAYKNWMFLGYLSGTIVAVNLVDRSHKVLGTHSQAIQDLAIDGDIMISGSHRSGPFQDILAEIKLWDLNSLENISEISLPVLYKTSIISGKALATVENKLMEWDFLIPPK
ncbi:MAG TPA: hypothetical protein VGP47_00820 [Parachlamydiaceae bacterium]|nr:hypothetical protein [Parachlamydiaceae bacterium]